MKVHADFFSRHACPLHLALVLLWQSTKQVEVQMVVPRTNVPGVHGKKQAGRFSESEQKRIDRERYLLLVFTFSFFFSFRRLSFLSDVV